MNIRSSANALRDRINKNAAISIAIAAVMIAGAVFAINGQFKPKTNEVGQVYFYDIENDSLFVAPMENIPVLRTSDTPDSEPTGACAFVFACKDCSDVTDRYIAWIEFYTKDAKDRLVRAEDMRPDIEIDRGHLMLKPDPTNPNWKKETVEYLSPEAVVWRNEASERCGPNLTPKNCIPVNSIADR